MSEAPNKAEQLTLGGLSAAAADPQMIQHDVECVMRIRRLTIPVAAHILQETTARARTKQ